VVVKVIKIRVDEEDPRPTELRRLISIPICNRIVRLLGSEMNEPSLGQCSLFLEFCPGGDLSKWRKEKYEERNNKPVPEWNIWRLFIQLAQALAFIHEGFGTKGQTLAKWNPIIHRDIKPENILIIGNEATYPSFKLADFGVSKMYDHNNTESECGSHIWQPPEIPRISTPAADVWSLGAVVHFLALGKAPVQNVKEYRGNVWNRLGGRYPTAYVEDPNDQYWNKKAPREVTHVNISVEEQMDEALGGDEDGEVAHTNQNPVYSDALDRWMLHALAKSAKTRYTSGNLVKRMIPVGKKMIQKYTGKAGLVDLQI
ncbi:kinase-like protein, partial [Lepidopterella palustris CBS 459.81]